MLKISESKDFLPRHVFFMTLRAVIFYPGTLLAVLHQTHLENKVPGIHSPERYFMWHVVSGLQEILNFFLSFTQVFFLKLFSLDFLTWMTPPPPLSHTPWKKFIHCGVWMGGGLFVCSNILNIIYTIYQWWLGTYKIYKTASILPSSLL